MFGTEGWGRGGAAAAPINAGLGGGSVCTQVQHQYLPLCPPFGEVNTINYINGETKGAPGSLREWICQNRGIFKVNFWVLAGWAGGMCGEHGRGAASALPEGWEGTKQNFSSGWSSWQHFFPYL